MSTAYSPSFQSLYLRHSSFSNPSLALLTSQLILQSFPCSTYVTAHSATLLSLLLRHRIFTYVTWRAAHVERARAHSPSFQSLHLRRSSFSNPSFATPTPQDFHLRHLASRPCQKSQSSFSKLSVTSLTSQLILQPFFRFSYATGFSLTSPDEPPMQNTT